MVTQSIIGKFKVASWFLRAVSNLKDKMDGVICKKIGGLLDLLFLEKLYSDFVQMIVFAMVSIHVIILKCSSETLLIILVLSFVFCWQKD